MKRLTEPFPPASFAGQVLGWPTQCGGLVCVGFMVAADVPESIGPRWLTFAWMGFFGVLVIVIPGLLLAASPRLLGGPVGWMLRAFDRWPRGYRRESLHDLGIQLAYLGLPWCALSVSQTALVLVLGATIGAVLIGVALCLLLLPAYVVGFWRLLRWQRRQKQVREGRQE
jgi:hypothetical protein